MSIDNRIINATIDEAIEKIQRLRRSKLHEIGETDIERMIRLHNASLVNDTLLQVEDIMENLKRYYE